MNLPQCKINYSQKLSEDEILFIGGGRFPNENYFLKLAENRKIFCIDRGIEFCYKLKIFPEILIGDFDSANKISVNWAIENNIKIFRHPIEKDFTDTQLALNLLNKNSVAILTGGFGGRLDHLFSTIFSCANSKNKIFLADDDEIIFYLRDSESVEIDFYKKPRALSLLPITKICEGVTTENLHWELNDAKIFQDILNTVSNRIESDKIKISVRIGTLAIYLNFSEFF